MRRQWRTAEPAPPKPGRARQVATETHLYVVRNRGDVEVFGKTQRRAWVVEDRNADGSILLGRMWIIDQLPRLVRWTITRPDGSGVQIDQELVAPKS